jgi:tRNA threonylcarbamoyl adenosine modification protein YeaZ/ribosomal-protein-alanine acetyltransferase
MAGIFIMTTSLAIDTSTSRTTVAIVKNGVLLAQRDHDDPIAHGEILPRLVAELLQIENSVDEVVIGMGPGPFTGLRVGIVFGQSFALARGIPWRGVCSLDSMAAQIKENDCIVAIDARRKEFFWAHYVDGLRVNEPQVALTQVVDRMTASIHKEGEIYPAAGNLPALDGNIREPLYIRRPDAYPMPKGVLFRPMNQMDLVVVSSLEKAIYAGEDPWSMAQFKEELAANDRYYLVAEKDGVVIGYCGAMLAGEVADILTITVDPQNRRQGIGREFLKRLIDWSRNKKVEAIMLEVRVGNDAAQPLYTSNGFYPLTTRKDYYGPGLTALVMRKDLR